MKIPILIITIVCCLSSFGQSDKLHYFTLEDTVFEQGSIYQIDSIEFDFDGYGLRPNSKKILIEVIKFLAKHPNLIVELSTHTDSRGNDQYNQEISEMRAQQLVDFIHQRGIPLQRLFTKGYGESQPYMLREEDEFLKSGILLTDEYVYKLENKALQEQCFQLNRRSEIKIIELDFVDTFDLFVDTLKGEYYWEKTLLIDSCSWKKGENVNIEGIIYDFDATTLRPESFIHLDRLVAFLKQNDSLIIEISNHSDCRGSDYYSVDLTQRRSEAVMAYLVGKGIDQNRIIAKGYGENMPFNYQGIGLTCNYIASVKSVEQKEYFHQLNRRTAFKILQSNYHTVFEGQIHSSTLNKGGICIIPQEQKEYGLDFSDSISQPISAIYNYLKANPDVQIQISVHSDCKGSEAKNLELTQKEAEQIENKLVELGIDSTRIIVRGLGESEPRVKYGQAYDCSYINSFSSEKYRDSCHQMNRRIEVQVLNLRN